VRPAAAENHRNPVTVSYLSGGDPEDPTEGIRPSGYRSKGWEIVMASLGGAGKSVAVVVGAGELGSATATLLAGARFTVVAVDRTPNALNELPGGIRREAGDNLELRPHSIRAPQLLDTSRNRTGHPGGADTRCPAGKRREHHRLPRSDRAALVSGAAAPAYGA
jgi:hypothetical protein